MLALSPDDPGNLGSPYRRQLLGQDHAQPLVASNAPPYILWQLLSFSKVRRLTHPLLECWCLLEKEASNSQGFVIPKALRSFQRTINLVMVSCTTFFAALALLQSRHRAQHRTLTALASYRPATVNIIWLLLQTLLKMGNL